jgi:glycosyltransferase involved in cell wall biosynthesis
MSGKGRAKLKKIRKSGAYICRVRIALIHTRLLLRGGLESRLLSYMGHFHAQGHQVTLYVHKRDPAVRVPEGVRVEVLPLKWIPKPLRAPFFDRLLHRRLAQQPQDLVISLGRTTCHDAVVVAGVHRAFQRALGKRLFGISDWVQAWMDGRCYAAPGVMLPASDMIAAQMVECHGADASRMEMLYPPTNPQRFHAGLKAQKQALREKHGFDPHKFSFVFISANHWLKGLDVLLAAFELLPPGSAELIVVGPQGLPRAVAGVRAIGFVKETEEIYAAADCTVLASRYDAFGQVVTESLLCGTPVIVSAMTGAKAVVGAEEGLVVPTMDPQDWAAAMQALMRGSYQIADDFAARNRLDFQAHMATLEAAAARGRQMRG